MGVGTEAAKGEAGAMVERKVVATTVVAVEVTGTTILRMHPLRWLLPYSTAPKGWALVLNLRHNMLIKHMEAKQPVM